MVTRVWGIFVTALIVAAITLWLLTHTGALDIVLPVSSDFVPIAIAVVGIVMSYKQPKEKNHLVATLTLIAAGLIGTGILSWNRIRSEAAHKLEMTGVTGRLDAVSLQNSKTLDTLVKLSTQPEVTPTQFTQIGKRQNILALLRNEYILSHTGLSAGLLAGTEQPPSEWLNNRLKQLGERWTVADPEVSLKVVHPKEFAVLVQNTSEPGVVVYDPKYNIAVWDLDIQDRLEVIPIPYTNESSSGFWLRASESWGPQPVTTSPQAVSLIKMNDRLFGFASDVTCRNCPNSKSYWIYAIHGKGGWYAELPSGYGPAFNAIIRALPDIKKDPGKFFAGISEVKRKPIEELP